MACFQAVRIKLSLACYRQPHKLVSRGILKAYNFFGKAQNRVVNLQDIRIEISFVFEKSESFPFPTSSLPLNSLNFTNKQSKRFTIKTTKLQMILYNFGQQMTVLRVLNHWDSRPDLVLAFSVLDETSFAFFSSVISLKNSHHLPDQSNVKLKLFVT